MRKKTQLWKTLLLVLAAVFLPVFGLKAEASEQKQNNQDYDEISTCSYDEYGGYEDDISVDSIEIDTEWSQTEYYERIDKNLNLSFIVNYSDGSWDYLPEDSYSMHYDAERDEDGYLIGGQDIEVNISYQGKSYSIDVYVHPLDLNDFVLPVILWSDQVYTERFNKYLPVDQFLLVVRGTENDFDGEISYVSIPYERFDEFGINVDIKWSEGCHNKGAEITEAGTAEITVSKDDIIFGALTMEVKPFAQESTIIDTENKVYNLKRNGCYQWDVKEAGRYDIYFSQSDLDKGVDLYNADMEGIGYYIYNSKTDDACVTTLELEEGTYYVQCHNNQCFSYQKAVGVKSVSVDFSALRPVLYENLQDQYRYYKKVKIKIIDDQDKEHIYSLTDGYVLNNRYNINARLLYYRTYSDEWEESDDFDWLDSETRYKIQIIDNNTSEEIDSYEFYFKSEFDGDGEEIVFDSHASLQSGVLYKMPVPEESDNDRNYTFQIQAVNNSEISLSACANDSYARSIINHDHDSSAYSGSDYVDLMSQNVPSEGYVYIYAEMQDMSEYSLSVTKANSISSFSLNTDKVLKYVTHEWYIDNALRNLSAEVVYEGTGEKEIIPYGSDKWKCYFDHYYDGPDENNDYEILVYLKQDSDNQQSFTVHQCTLDEFPSAGTLSKENDTVTVGEPERYFDLYKVTIVPEKTGDYYWHMMSNDHNIVTGEISCPNNQGAWDDVDIIREDDSCYYVYHLQAGETYYYFMDGRYSRGEEAYGLTFDCVLKEYKDAEEAHEHVWNDGEITKEASCTEAGEMTYTCTVEGCAETKTEEIAAKGHTEVIDEAVEATCTATGLSEGSHCSECKEVFTAQEETPAKGHKWNTGETTKEVSCEQTGEKTYTCEVCQDTKTEEIAAKGHTEVVDEAVEATCTATGLSEGSHCSECKEVLTAQQEIPAKGHKWNAGKTTKEANCEQTGEKTYTCEVCQDTKTEEIEAKGHTEVVDKESAATCTTDGKTEGIHCSVCNKILKEQQVVKAKGHVISTFTVIKEASCTEAGERTAVCEVCSEKYIEEIPVLGHHEVPLPAVQATCTKAGSTEGIKCDRCNTVLSGGQTIDAVGHNYTAVKVKATLTKSGYTAMKCSSCGSIKDRVDIAYPEKIALTKTALVYTGKTIKPGITIKDENGNAIANTNYTVTWPSSKAIGQYTVKVVFKGNYTGTKTLTFNIVPKATKIVSVTAKTKAFTLKWAKQATQTSGYQIQYSTSAKFTNPKYAYVTKNTTVSTTISKLTAKKKYFVRIRTYKTVNKKKYYSSWSGVKYVTTK